MTGRKLFAGVAVMALIFAACGGSDTTASTDVVVTSVAPTTTVPPTTTTTVPPTTTTTLSQEELDAVLLEEDTATIKSFWREYSDAWFGGVESGVAFASVHNHPLLGECPPEQLAEFWSYPEGWIEEVIVASVELDEGWAIPPGSHTGAEQVPGGRVYIVTAQWSDPVESLLREIHTSIDDDGVWGFTACDG